MPKCPEPGCKYEAKTKGAITQHVKREHGDDPLTAVRNAIGPGAPRPGGAFRTDRPLTAAPSGVPSVDFAIGIGGVPRGTIIEVFGPAASGKTFMALTFSAYAQQQGRRAGYMDAERALQPTFAELVPGLDLDALEYGPPPGIFGIDPEPFDGTGESALEASRRFIASGEFAVWTVDSVHACKPREAMKRAIGDAASMAALAKLFNDALGIMEADISRTDTVAVFVNHVKDKPGVQFGRDWSKPGGSAFDYYASIQLHVTPGTQYFNKEGRRIGHEVRVKVHKSKVAAPHAKASYDLFYADDIVVPKKGQNVQQRAVKPGVDIPSCWFSVLSEADVIKASGGRYVLTETGEVLGDRQDLHDALSEDSALLKKAREIVYPATYVPAAA
jgi:recombination protein RecA